MKNEMENKKMEKTARGKEARTLLLEAKELSQ